MRDSTSLRLRVNTNFAYSRPSIPALMNSIKLNTSMSSPCFFQNALDLPKTDRMERANRSGLESAGRALDQSK